MRNPDNFNDMCNDAIGELYWQIYTIHKCTRIGLIHYETTGQSSVCYKVQYGAIHEVALVNQLTYVTCAEI